jgi:hypothetical protein
MKSPFLIGLAGGIEASYNAGGAVDPSRRASCSPRATSRRARLRWLACCAARHASATNQRRVAPSGARMTGTFQSSRRAAASPTRRRSRRSRHVLRQRGWLDAARHDDGRSGEVGLHAEC